MDFHRVREKCLAIGRLWEDREFDAVDSSIFFKDEPYYDLVWKRPHEIVSDPRFVVEGVSRFDIRQGKLGNCWLLSAVTNLTMQPALFSRVVPKDQGFVDKYAGVFHFRFWRFGTWVEVLVDDRLPTVEGKLAYLHSADPGEFWSALLEKAYAKLFGSYEALKGGGPGEAMTDFTGGVLEEFDLKDPPPNLYQILQKAFEKYSLMSCSIEAEPGKQESRTPEGLLTGHAYSITRVQKVNVVTSERRGQVPLVRIRNPWGTEDTWTGPWSDNSPEWRVVPESEKKGVELSFRKDGEFWMSFRDFVKYFGTLEICNLTPDSLMEGGQNMKLWEVHMYDGEWVRGVTAGGCRNYLDTFYRNPQYRITLTDVDDEDDEPMCTVVISLLQKNRRGLGKLGGDLLTIGFIIFKLQGQKGHPTPLDKDFFKYNASVGKSHSYVNKRQVSNRFKLPPGVYCIIPTAFEPDQEGEFLLRVFTEKKQAMEENDNKVEFTSKTRTPLESSRSSKDRNIEDRKLSDTVYDHFRRVAGKDKEVDWLELKEVLDHGLQAEALSMGGVSKDMCRSMIAMCDSSFSGRLNVQEFKWLWQEIIELRNVYHRFREGPGGRLRTSELREALLAAGYRLNAQVLNMLAHRYAGRDGKVPFDDFLMCTIKLFTMINYFKKRDVKNSYKTEFTLQQWIMHTVGC